MSRLLKCYGYECVEAGLKHPAEALTLHNSKKYCPKCLAEKIKDDSERSRLFSYVCKIFDLPFANPQIMKQAKNFKETYKISYMDQLLTVNFVVERTMFNLDQKYGIGFIPTFYHQMLDELAMTSENKVSIENFKEEEGIIVKRGSTQSRKSSNIEVIDMDSI